MSKTDPNSAAGGTLDKIKHASNHYRCKRCGKTFERLQRVRDHANSHIDDIGLALVEVVDR